MKASETVGGQKIRWTKGDVTREGIVRVYDEGEGVIGVRDAFGRIQIIMPTQECELVE